MKAVSLFSGVGGIEIGFDRAAIDTVLQVEIDPWAQEVLARAWPETERIADVRDLLTQWASPEQRSGARDVGAGGAGPDAQHLREPHGDTRDGADVRAEVREERAGGTDRRARAEPEGSGGPDGEGRRGAPRVDLVYGGVPCQDVSVAGKRAGLAGGRTGLWFEVPGILRALRPRWFVLENVVGLLSSNEGRDFAVILDALDELGFDAAWAVLDAQHFGVAQRRRRVFLVAGPRADLEGRSACEAVLALCEGCGGHPPSGRTTGEDVAAGITGSSGRNGESGTIAAIGPIPDLAGTIGMGQSGGFRTTDLDSVGAYIPDIVGQAVNAKWAKGSSGPAGDETFNMVATNGVRRLTPRECERLQGWPDDHTRWTADGRELADSHRYRMVGNGVASPVVEWLGMRLVAVDAALRERGE